MTEETPQVAGSIARKAAQTAKIEETGGESVSLPEMVGVGETITLNGQTYIIQPLIVERKTRLDSLVEALGDDLYQSILVYDNPDGFMRMARMGEQSRRAQMTERLSLLRGKRPKDQTEDEKHAIRVLETYLATDPVMEDISKLDAQVALRTQMAALTQEQITAMMRIVQLFLGKEIELNGEVQVVRLSIDEIKRVFPLNAFPPFLNRCLDVTQIHP